MYKYNIFTYIMQKVQNSLNLLFWFFFLRNDPKKLTYLFDQKPCF